MEKTTLGGGCFWCLDALFRDLQGVESVLCGYSGGNVDDPSYKSVCSGRTGHAEVVQITFNPEIISFKSLLEIFLSVHDPTTLNRQGADVGTQYRSIILYHSEEQKKVSESVISEFTQQQVWSDPIVTQIVPFVKFFEAEEYHQNYFNKNPNQGYCQVVINPKLIKFRKTYSNLLK